eukprot:SM000307S11695  [mRNA]  locus=s307:21016:26353:- [translate_table: standard]
MAGWLSAEAVGAVFMRAAAGHSSISVGQSIGQQRGWRGGNGQKALRGGRGGGGRSGLGVTRSDEQQEELHHPHQHSQQFGPLAARDAFQRAVGLTAHHQAQPSASCAGSKAGATAAPAKAGTAAGKDRVVFVAGKGNKGAPRLSADSQSASRARGPVHTRPTPGPGKGQKLAVTVDSVAVQLAELQAVPRSKESNGRCDEQLQQWQHRSETRQQSLGRHGTGAFREGLGADFGKRRSTRVVSKLHLGRQRSNLGRHSSQAESAAEELLAIPLSRCDRLAHAVGDTLERCAGQLEGMEDLSYILRELGNAGDSEKALAAFNWMVHQQKDGTCVVGGMRGPLDWGKLASTMISTLGRLGRVEAAQAVFEQAQEAGMRGNVYAYSALLSAYGRSGRCREALDLFKKMKVDGCQPNLITYNTVIDACSKGGTPYARARELFEEMQKEGVQPDRITYNSLMAVCSRAGQWEEAGRLFEDMVSKKIERDVFTFNTYIDALCKAQQMKEAALVVENMSFAGVAPNVVTYSTMIDGYGKAGSPTDALLVYNKMKSMNIRPDRVTFNTLLDIHGKAGKLEEALAICSEMESAGLKTDVVTYNALIDAHGKQGRCEEAFKLFEDMRAQGLRPNVLTYSALVGAFSKAGRHVEAMEVFREFRRTGMQADVVLYSALIDAHGKHGLVEEALALLSEMIAAGISPNIVTYNSLIDAYGRRGQVDRAIGTIRTMRDVGIVPNAITYNSVIDAYGKEGRAGEALAVFHQMKTSGTAPDAVTFSALIDANGKRGDMLAAVRMFREMKDAGVKPNVVTFSAILSACSRCGTWEEASSLLEEMRHADWQVYGVAYGLLMGTVSWGKANSPALEQTERLFDSISCLDRSTGTAFYNALTDLLWHFGQRYGAGKVLAAAQRRKVYANATWSSQQEAGLDLHLLSVGAALAMLHAWLLDLHALTVEGREVPRLLSILTGWGKHSKVLGDSTVKRAVEELLAAAASPFHVAKYNEGRIVSSGSAATVWLTAPGTLHFLTLSDARGSWKIDQAYLGR